MSGPWDHLRKAKPHKYGAKRAVGSDGTAYASKAEANAADELRLLRQTGHIRDFLEQVPIRLTPKVKYVCDFMVIENEGSVRFVELKGFETETWRLKHKLLRDLRPEIAKLLTVRKA